MALFQVRPTDRQLVTGALFVAVALAGLDNAAVTTATPTVVGELGGLSLYAWVFSAYLLASTVTVPLYGRLADAYGRKRLFLFATGLFAVGSVLCGLAQSMEQLIVARAVQGLGAGGITPITFTIAGDVFALEERARIFGFFSATWGVAALLGPGIGGFLTEQVSWRWVFLLNLPLTLAAMGLIWGGLRERLLALRPSLDLPGAFLLTTAMLALLFGTQDRTPAAGAALRWLLVLSAFLCVALVLWERRARNPILPLGLLGTSAIGGGALNALLMGVLLFCQQAFVPPFLQGAMALTPTQAGLVLAATSIGWPIGAAIVGPAVIRWGFRLVGAAGGALLVFGFGLLWRLTPNDSPLYAAAIQAVIGGGFGILGSVNLLPMQSAVSWEQRGVITSLNQFARSVGGTIGVTLVGALFVSAAAASAVAGLDPMDLLSETARRALSPGLIQSVADALAGALSWVYLALFLVAVGALASALVLPPRVTAPRSPSWHPAAGQAGEK